MNKTAFRSLTFGFISVCIVSCATYINEAGVMLKQYQRAQTPIPPAQKEVKPPIVEPLSAQEVGD